MQLTVDYFMLCFPYESLLMRSVQNLVRRSFSLKNACNTADFTVFGNNKPIRTSGSSSSVTDTHNPSSTLSLHQTTAADCACVDCRRYMMEERQTPAGSLPGPGRPKLGRYVLSHCCQASLRFPGKF